VPGNRRGYRRATEGLAQLQDSPLTSQQHDLLLDGLPRRHPLLIRELLVEVKYRRGKTLRGAHDGQVIPDPQPVITVRDDHFSVPGDGQD
jgi:hypothetical protein